MFVIPVLSINKRCPIWILHLHFNSCCKTCNISDCEISILGSPMPFELCQLNKKLLEPYLQLVVSLSHLRGPNWHQPMVVHLPKWSETFWRSSPRLLSIWSRDFLCTHGWNTYDKSITIVVQVYGIPGYGHWANVTDPDVGPEHDVILGWNEPNQADQANIPPDVAALAWIEHQEKYADKV